ncbi:MAG: hypothetical protein ABEJ74_08220 [Haloferacaceae archaeon]
MPRSRRALLRASAAAGLLSLTGCIAQSNPSSPPTDDPDTTTEPAGTTTDTPPGTPYPNRTVEFPEGPKSRPARPADLTRESVREFVHTHEYRYVYNSLWYNEHTDVSLECSVQSVEQRRDGYRAIVECTGSSNTGGNQLENSTRTATQVHADYFTQTYVYYVDENSLLRLSPDETDASETSSPTARQ